MNLQSIEHSSDAERLDYACQALQKAFENKCMVTIRHDKWVIHEPTGYMFSPNLFQVQGTIDEDVSTGTTVEILHPKLFPDGIYEYQYSFAKDGVFDSMVQGFELWIDSDVTVLFASIEDKPEQFMYLTMDTPPDEDTQIHRQVIFGNVMRYGGTKTEDNPEKNSDTEHDFCPCCLFTQNIELFGPLLKTNKNYAVRLFVSRNDEGETDADCRLNGDEWEEAKPKLKAYADTWKGEGMEFRKQYVIIKAI